MPGAKRTPKRKVARKKSAARKKAAGRKTARKKKAARKAATGRSAGRRRAKAQPAVGTDDIHARISSAAVRSRTRRSWSAWFQILDSAGCEGRTHREIVKYLTTNYGRLSPWWSQMIAGAYEQARGMRARHEMPDGFQITSSKTVGVSSGKLFKAFRDGAVRKSWLPGHAIEITKATPSRSMRIRWTDGRSLLSANFYPRGPRKAQVALVHRKLKDAREAARLKAFWKERLAVLKDALET